MDVATAVGRTLVELGIDRAFGVVGSGNFHVTNAMVDAGARFVAARHENGAATMADGYARMSDRVAAVTLHQGCGLTNAMTGLTEAAKSRTPLVVVAADVTEPRSNFYVDQHALASAVDAVSTQVDDAASAVTKVTQAYVTARDDRRTVLLNLPLRVQGDEVAPADAAAAASAMVPLSGPPLPTTREPDPIGLPALVEALHAARRPVFVAGRGARGSRNELRRLGDACGALLATSAVAKGLFHDDPWSLDVSGGFASPLAAELIQGADLIVGWGCALNMWTMRHGRLIGPDTVVAQVDLDDDAIGAHCDIAVGVQGGVTETARAATAKLSAAIGPIGQRGADNSQRGYRTDEIRSRLARGLRWRDVPYDDTSTADRIDPRTLTIDLDDLLPAERIVSIDSGNFMGYPSMFLSVPDEHGFCFTQAFQSIGLGLATAIGAALAQPERLPVAALGDGGALMAAAELETVARLSLPMVVIVYNDAAYGAEVHHFGPDGYPLETVRFPDTDIAAIGRGYGFDAVTVRRRHDLGGVRSWLDGDRRAPLLVDAKVTGDSGSWWLEEAFRGH